MLHLQPGEIVRKLILFKEFTRTLYGNQIGRNPFIY